MNWNSEQQSDTIIFNKYLNDEKTMSHCEYRMKVEARADK